MLLVGEALRIIREAKDVRLRDLAKVMNVSPSLISLIERGEREPKLSFLENVSKQLQIPQGVLIHAQLISRERVTHNCAIFAH